MKRLSLAFSLIFVLAAAGVGTAGAQLKIRWSRPVADGTTGSPAFFPNDSSPNSLVVGDAAGRILRFGPAGELLFSYEMGERSNCSPAVGDLNGDGVPEVVSATVGGQVHCVDEGGRLLWKAQLGGQVDYTLVVADVDGDGTAEVLVTSKDGWVHCFDGDGALLWQFFAEPQAGPVAVGDLTGDGRPEVVFGTDLGEIFCLRNDGSFLWRTSLDGHFGRSLALLTDVVGGGPVDVLITRSEVCRNPAVLALDGCTGALLWEAPTPMHGYGPLAVADVDGDGEREILVVDKSTSLTCLDLGGARKWTRSFTGRGCFYPPAVADLDGDGRPELVLGARQEDSLRVLDGRGLELAGLYLEGGTNCSPSVGDLDGDGVLEVYLLTQKPGRLVRLDASGVRARGRVLWSSWRGDCGRSGYVRRVDEVVKARARKLPVPRTARLRLREEVLLGRNWVDFPVPASTSGVERTVQASLEEEGGPVTRRLFCVGKRASTLRIPFDVVSPDTARFVITVFRGRQTVPAARWVGRVSVDGFRGDLALLAREKAGLDSLLRVLPEDDASGRIAIAGQKSRLAGFAEYLRAAWPRFARETRSWRATFAREVESRRKRLLRKRKTLRFLTSVRVAGLRQPFICWEDPNPWDERDPEEEYPQRVEPCSLRVLALGNETESRSLHVTNLTDQPLWVKVYPAKWQNGVGRPEPPDSVLTLRQVAPVGTEKDGFVRDALPALAQGNVFLVPPLATTDLWLTFDTHGLAPGVYRGKLELLGLRPDDPRVTVSVELWVSTVRLPEESVLAFCTWPHLGADASDPLAQRRFRDLLRHGETVFIVSPPVQRYDERGNLVGKVDWSQHDAWARRILGHGIMLVPSFQYRVRGPESAPLWSPAWARAYKSALLRYVAHLKELGFDYADFALYPVDEPWLTGKKSVQELLTCARLAKEADPGVQIYCDPAGAPTPENSAAAVPFIDIWCPQIDLLKQDKKLLDFYKSTGAQVWCYEAPGNQKLLKPLGLYRMQPWLAFRYGLTGCGMWTYNYRDLWPSTPSGRFTVSYGLVYEGGGSIVPSRRWEAYRDGVEDFNLLTLLKSEVERGGEATRQAAELLDEAVSTLTAGQERAQSINRLIIEYDPDYHQLLEYRARLIHALERLKQARKR